MDPYMNQLEQFIRRVGASSSMRDGGSALTQLIE